MAHALFDGGLVPVQVAEPYQPAADVVRFAPAKLDPIVAEVIRRGQNFGFRCIAWVAWRDAGNFVRDHSWHEVKQGDGILDTIQDAEAIASAFVESKGVTLEPWRAAT